MTVCDRLSKEDVDEAVDDLGRTDVLFLGEGKAGKESGSSAKSSPSSSSISSCLEGDRAGLLPVNDWRRGEEAWARTLERECRDLVDVEDDDEGDEGRAKCWEVGEISKEGSSVQSSDGTKLPTGGGTGDIASDPPREYGMQSSWSEYRMRDVRRRDLSSPTRIRPYDL
jgi:hypothetical protein